MINPTERFYKFLKAKTNQLYHIIHTTKSIITIYTIHIFILLVLKAYVAK